jgi:cytochrome c
MKSRIILLAICAVALIFASWKKMSAPTTITALVFSKTEGYRHASIPAGIAALKKLAAEKGNLTLTFTEDAALFTEANLKKYGCVIFLNTTGDVLNGDQQYIFERYIQAGGGYVGIHAATDTEYDWAWYGGLAGAYFLDHPSSPSNVLKGKFTCTHKDHWATKGMPQEFEHTDEFYSFKNISKNINVVLKIDEKSYKGGKNGDDHPMSWYQEYDGGRSFYTALGHTNESYADPLLMNHIYAGIQYAAGGDNPKPLDYNRSKPEENRFTKVVLAEKLDEPMELSVLDENRILFIQRKGEVRLFNIKTKELKTIATIPVSTKYKNKAGRESTAEDGLMGLSKDPNFAQNHWIYLYYSTPEEPKNILTRFELNGDVLNLASKKTLLEVGTQREECCHTGGSIAWDKNGNLYLSTGDNTNPHASSGYSPSDEGPERGPWDAQKSSANTNDLRGKIIRIKPQADGTYTIPEGNLFAPGTPLTRPEIYTMGHRNPFRISVDQRTGYVYWGEVGPDANAPNPDRGPAGHDEIGQARKPGNYGWPHFVGDNKAYNKYDFVNKKSLEKWDANAPTNNSPYNTGMKVLPPAQKAFVWYPYAASEEFPLVGAGGRNAMAGPVYYADDFKNAERAFPAYYDKKFLAYEWMRGWLMAITMDKEGNYQSMERIMPSYKFSNPMDMEFAANGDLYMLEYGTGWFSANDDARLIRIEYNKGNRKPQIQMAANQMGGALPFNLKLTSKGTTDADLDELKYNWKISSKNGYLKNISTPEANVTLTTKGIYQVELTVTDSKGLSNVQTMEISAGNEPPSLDLAIESANSSFYFVDKSLNYKVQVYDKEDGKIDEGISTERVAMSIDYLAEGYDKVAIAQGHRSADDVAQFSEGRKLIGLSDCASCHKRETKSIGPNYLDIAKKYKSQQGAIELLSKKIISGGAGVWGETAMAGHPQFTAVQASEMVKYIMSLGDEKAKSNNLPVTGKYVTSLPKDDKGRGVFIMRAAYEDNGAKGIPAMRSERSIILRNAKMDAHAFDAYSDMNKLSFGGRNLVIPTKSGAYMLLNKVDLKGIKNILFTATAPRQQANAVGGKIELRLGKINGPKIGESAFLSSSPAPPGTPAKPLDIPIKMPAEISGKQDLYAVFVNEKTPNGTIMVVTGVEFVQ